MHHWQGLNIEAEGCGISKPLSYQVNLLGKLLGHGIREQVGENIFSLVEELRLLCKDANQSGDEALFRQVQKKIKSLTLDEIVWLVRAYTTFFSFSEPGRATGNYSHQSSKRTIGELGSAP